MNLGSYAGNEIVKIKTVAELCALFCRFCESGFTKNNSYNIGRMNFISMVRNSKKNQMKVFINSIQNQKVSNLV